MKKKINIIDIIRPDLKNIKAYSSARDEFSSEDKMIFLDANENPFDTDLNRYPDPYQSRLKSKISQIKGIPADQIVLGNGSDEIIDLLIRLFCKPDQDNIMTFPPTYGMYKVLADLNAVQVKQVFLDQDFQLDAEEALKQTSEFTKIIFVCTPNNPSGNTIKKQEIIKLLENFNGIVIIDEAYIDFSNEGSCLKLLENYQNLVIMQTFSKAYGLAGIRLGMCFANSIIVEYLNKIKPPYNVNSLTQKEALKRLSSTEKVSEEVELILAEREKLSKALENITWVKKIYPSQANFLLVKVDDANLRYKQCIGKNIVVRNRHTQANCENCLRFTIGTPIENKILIQALKQL
jgi:histidinol-phosphate aminotransferase